MDADGSHQPEQLHRLLEALRDADLVIGSRWVPGGSVVNWPRRREALSRGGNLYVRLLLGIGVRDATAGFRVFRRSALEKIDLASVQSTGYVFQTDLVARSLRAGLRGARGAHRVRRAGPRRLQDERRRGHRVAAPDHPVGAARAPPSRCDGQGAGPRWLPTGARRRAPAPVASPGCCVVAVRRGAAGRDLRDHPGRPGRSAPWWTILLLVLDSILGSLADPARGRPRLAGAARRPSTAAGCRPRSWPTGR